MRKTLLVVEDDLLMARHYERVLASEYSVISVTNAVEAIAILDSRKIDVLLIDMLLTGTTAMALFHEMASHEDLSQIPIVVVSSIADQMTLSSLTPYGVRYLLDKTTMTPEDIVATVGAVL